MARTNPVNSKYRLIQKASSMMFVATVIASVLVAFSAVTLKMLWESRSFNNKVQKAMEETRDTLKANIENYKNLEEEFVQLENADPILEAKEQGEKSNSAVILDALPSKYDFPAIVTAVQNLATQSGVELTSINGNDEIGTSVTTMPNPTPIEMPFKVSITGTYVSIQRFLEKLQLTVRPYYVDSISFAGSDQNMKVSFEMKTFYQPAIGVMQIETMEITQ